MVLTVEGGEATAEKLNSSLQTARNKQFRMNGNHSDSTEANRFTLTNLNRKGKIMVADC